MRISSSRTIDRLHTAAIGEKEKSKKISARKAIEFMLLALLIIAIVWFGKFNIYIAPIVAMIMLALYVLMYGAASSFILGTSAFVTAAEKTTAE